MRPIDLIDGNKTYTIKVRGKTEIASMDNTLIKEGSVIVKGRAFFGSLVCMGKIVRASFLTKEGHWRTTSRVNIHPEVVESIYVPREKIK